MNGMQARRTILVFLLLAGCGGGARKGETGNDEAADPGGREKEFTPSEFDRPPEVLLEGLTAEARDSVVEVATPSPLTEPELIPGFRVQIYSSSDIDEANAIKTAAEEQFTTEKFYIVYDPPIYKVRAGDFASRHEADRFARALKEGGYSDSWIVPDRVTKRLPPR